MTLAIHPVEGTRRAGRRFGAVARAIYSPSFPAWTPPLADEEVAQFEPARNPSLAATEAARWIAVDSGIDAGRVAAFAPRDPAGVGYFGYFECRDDPDVARALLRAAERWLRVRGRFRVYGPIAITPRDQIGLLTEGFETPATLFTPFNPPWYAGLLAAAGYRPAIGLSSYAWRPGLPDETRLIPRIERFAGRGGVTIRPLRVADLEEETLRISGLLNESFASTWSFPPITPAEARLLARQLRPIVDPSLVLIAEAAGRPCGVALTLPDANWLVRRMGGRLWPFGWLVAVRHRRRIPQARFMALAVRPGHRVTGTAARLLLATHRALLAGGYEFAELTQVFEENRVMHRLLERIGCPVIKRYAVFERSLEEGGPA
jgi:GNAT superfamily N-acetyltransferase